MRRPAKILIAVCVVAIALVASRVRFVDVPAVPMQVDAPEQAAAGALIVPVAGVERAALVDSYQDARGGDTRLHRAIDISAPRGTPVFAAAAGTVEKLFESKDGGHTVYIRVPDRRSVHYYAHLDRYADGLAEGRRIAGGQPIGTVGSSGNADPLAPHLHFEIKRMRTAERWWEGTPTNPYPLLAGKPAAR